MRLSSRGQGQAYRRRSIFGAVQPQQVYVADANAYTNRSGLRLVCGLEMFAQMLHPESFSEMIPAGGAARLSAAQLQASSSACPLPL